MNAADTTPIQRLDRALANERKALLEHDAEGLLSAVQAKIVALRELEGTVAPEQRAQLRRLAEINRANGVLLARRRQRVNWALRLLGRSENSPAYDARGQAATLQASRSLAVA